LNSGNLGMRSMVSPTRIVLVKALMIGTFDSRAAELADGADVAFSDEQRASMRDNAFVETRGLRKAGHAAHPPCSADTRWIRVTRYECRHQ
jgi:hypothetical protein